MTKMMPLIVGDTEATERDASGPLQNAAAAKPLDLNAIRALAEKSSQRAISASGAQAHTILPHELPQALERAPAGIKTLSLDCFDTLLWRDTHAPSDVFADLPCVLLGQRVEGEANARKVARTLKRRNEVTLDEIYAQVMPFADIAARNAAIAAEIEAEARACFAFAPTVELMLDAKARGLQVIIVSDTYLSADQLRSLIAAAAGDQVEGLIDRIFASSEAGISKGEGLLGNALKSMKRAPEQVLHIGDNPSADYESALRLGVPALHLVQFGDSTERRLRYEKACGQLNADGRDGLEASPIGQQPHRALLAAGEPRIHDDAQALGYSVLGPVFTAYDGWLREEAAKLERERGGTVHWLFMLRDGHLPDLVHEAGGRAASTGRVEISRFVATAASLTTREAYERHVALEHGLNPPTLARQMLMSEDEIQRVVGDPKAERERAEASQRLLSELRRGQRQKLTIRRARDMADTLVAHVRAAVDPQPGDTLMLVDLGYNGSAQNAIDALLTERLGVRVAGRYLLCRERSATGLDKTGLIDARHFDPGLLEALCANVAVIEQLATCELGSVLGYDAQGEPIRKESGVKGGQSAVRERVQVGAAQFAKAARSNPIVRERDTNAAQAWRGCAASVLTRFLFLPDARELSALKSFEHDVNLGSERMVALFDPEDAAERMKRRGLFYMKGSSRMFLPADLSGEDISTRLSLLVQKRFNIALTYADTTSRKLDLTALTITDAETAASAIAARPTHDGYYVARLPIARKARAVALQLGDVFKWVEIASVTRSRVETLTGALQDEVAQACKNVRYDDMDERAPGLFECQSRTSLIMITPGKVDEEEEPGPHMIEVVLRPIKRRQADNEPATDQATSPSAGDQDQSAA
ncbi:MAG: HAD family hydrolase [Pseudomonadota bacterium]